MRIALDFDGVLSHHGAVQPAQAILDWLKKLNNGYSLKNVCIYSNNLFPARIEYLKNAFPEIDIIYYKKKKPYPNDLLEFMQSRKLYPQEILIIDDRLTAGILSACIIGAQSLLVTKPIMNYHASPIKESFYMLLRHLERTLLRCLS